MNNHFPPVHGNIQSAPKHIFDITHHFEDASKLLFLFIDRKLFFIAQIRRGMVGRRRGEEEEGVCQAVEAVPCKTRPCIPGMRAGFPQPPTTQPHSSLSRGKKHHQNVKRGKWEEGWMQAGENRGQPLLSIMSMEDRVILGHSLALESRGEAQAPPFHLPERGSAGEWASTAGSSPFATGRLRGNSDSWRGGAGKWELAQSPRL